MNSLRNRKWLQEASLSAAIPAVIGALQKIVKPVPPATMVLSTPEARRKRRMRRDLGKTSKTFSPDRMSRI